MKKIIVILAAILVLAVPLVFSEIATMTVSVGNTEPILDNIKINNIDSGATVDPTAGTTTTVTLYAEATDANGWGDVSSISCIISGPGTVEGSPAALVLTQLDSDTANATGTFTMDFYDAAGTYNVNCTATDAGSLKGSRKESYTYNTLTALDLDAATIAFGSMSAGGTTTVTGDTSMATLNNATIKNTGNAQIDAKISGTDLTSGGNTITVTNVQDQFTALGWNALTIADRTETGLNLAAGSSSTTNVDFKLTVPIGTVSGAYSGSTTITAIAG